MSKDQPKYVEQPDVDVECSICGHVGGPYPACETCHGNRTFVQSRAITRTEETQGAKTDADRYSRTGDVNPKIVDLPGSMRPSGH